MTGKTARSLASTMPVTGVPAFEVKVVFFACSISSSSVVGGAEMPASSSRASL